MAPSDWVRAFPAAAPVLCPLLTPRCSLLLPGAPSPFPDASGSLLGWSALCLPLLRPARPPEVSHASFPSSTCRIYEQGLRAAIGLRPVRRPYPPCPPDAVPVRQARGLPPASFRLRLAVDVLALGCALPAAGRARDFHPLEACACSAHRKSGARRFRRAPLRFRGAPGPIRTVDTSFRRAVLCPLSSPNDFVVVEGNNGTVPISG